MQTSYIIQIIYWEQGLNQTAEPRRRLPILQIAREQLAIANSFDPFALAKVQQHETMTYFVIQRI